VHDTDWICVSNQENYIEPTAMTAITHVHLTENVHSVKRRSLRKVGAQANKCILVDRASEDADAEQVGTDVELVVPNTLSFLTICAVYTSFTECEHGLFHLIMGI